MLATLHRRRLRWRRSCGAWSLPRSLPCRLGKSARAAVGSGRGQDAHARLRQRRGSVVLYDEYVETVDAQGRAVEREREAIRILQPQGRHDVCSVSYDVDEKINYFREWTITADEKQYQAKDTDFVDEGERTCRSPSCCPRENPRCASSCCRYRRNSYLRNRGTAGALHAGDGLADSERHSCGLSGA